MNRSRATHLQLAADLVSDLADAVGSIGDQLDKLHKEIGDDLFSYVAKAFPVNHEAFGPKASDALLKLARDWTPPDDYDPADKAM